MDTENIGEGTLGQRIKQIRLNLGLSMEQFIERIDNKSGKGRSGTVNNWESNKNAPNKKRLKHIADLGGVSVDNLLHGSSAQRDCPYCHGKKPLISYSYEDAYIELYFDGLHRLTCSYAFSDDEFGAKTKNIKYCPMCGRKLV